jgi:uncharacterized membrane protein
MRAPNKSAGRLQFIDWTRGLAALVMLQGHTFNSFARTDLRDKSAYVLSQFAGGLPPAIFLFLTGITFAFLMHSQERKNESSWRRVVAALKRSRYLFLVAFLFRIQLFVFGYPNSPASEILKVDILNCMGLAMLIFAPMAVFSTLERARLCTVLGLVIAGMAPVISALDGDGVPWILRAYFVPSLNYFAFFPWAAFLAFGMAAGSVLRLVKQEDMQKVMLWALGLGVAMALAAQYMQTLPYSLYPKSDFWLNGPALTIIKLAVVLCMMAGAYVWVNLAGEPSRWSFVRQIGTTSLLVYWVHIELVYGRWFGFWKENLSTPQVVVFTVCLIGLMLLLSLLQTRFTDLGSFFKPAPAITPQRASGD